MHLTSPVARHWEVHQETGLFFMMFQLVPKHPTGQEVPHHGHNQPDQKCMSILGKNLPIKTCYCFQDFLQLYNGPAPLLDCLPPLTMFCFCFSSFGIESCYVALTGLKLTIFNLFFFVPGFIMFGLQAYTTTINLCVTSLNTTVSSLYLIWQRGNVKLWAWRSETGFRSWFSFSAVRVPEVELNAHRQLLYLSWHPAGASHTWHPTHGIPQARVWCIR